MVALVVHAIEEKRITAIDRLAQLFIEIAVQLLAPTGDPVGVVLAAAEGALELCLRSGNEMRDAQVAQVAVQEQVPLRTAQTAHVLRVLAAIVIVPVMEPVVVITPVAIRATSVMLFVVVIRLA